MAPFDHPQLFVPNGHPGDNVVLTCDDDGQACDDLVESPAVGAGGRPAEGLDPLETFLRLEHIDEDDDQGCNWFRPLLIDHGTPDPPWVGRTVLLRYRLDPLSLIFRVKSFAPRTQRCKSNHGILADLNCVPEKRTGVWYVGHIYHDSQYDHSMHNALPKLRETLYLGVRGIQPLGPDDPTTLNWETGWWTSLRERAR